MNLETYLDRHCHQVNRHWSLEPLSDSASGTKLAIDSAAVIREERETNIQV